MSNQTKYEEILASTSEVIAVVAGPGSGKTKGILIPKTRSILQETSIDSDHVVLLTFSRLSALDTKNRFKEDQRAPRVSTLHSLCLAFLLSEDNHDIRKRVDSIVLDFEKEILLSDIKLAMPEVNKRKLRSMLGEFSAGWAVQPHDQVFVENEEKKKFKALVVNWLDEYSAAMMEEIVYHAVKLAKQVQSSFIDKPKYILVDEFQDLNKLEQEFIDLLGENSKLVLIVGDPDQSIYSFKYAHPDGIMEFTKREGVDNHSLEYTGRCSQKIVELANKLLLQDNPERTSFLKSLPNKEAGSVTIKDFRLQEEEFDYVCSGIAEKIDAGETPQEIIVLAPKKKLANEFVKYANEKNSSGQYSFRLASKIELSQLESERILLFSLISNPESSLHIRSYIGLGDATHYAREIRGLKERYGNIKTALDKADPNDFNPRQQRLRDICTKLISLREFLDRHKEDEDLGGTLDELFPEGDEGLKDIRDMVFSLREDNDSARELFLKFNDYLRSIETKDNQIKVMTLLASKGLEANHIYLIGCSDGNIPGNNRSVNLDDHQFKHEQRRLLYVGITRAKEAVTVTWSRNIPFEQARGHHTADLGTTRINGKVYSRVGISEFLQDL